ncbi:metallophosphoesterase [Spongiibacter nanhainus]|uniref:Metallophosphoesterase n=1 Tax=Spongiibacter nanhainus TaxID=2794344 RepID=A0A7T4R280_9GAMM|nr:metallophosphoesterase [Spongiibacter nanhainus]QQD19106.1 metallophosphoesterase [Spongiibacter nanhainus]
MLHSKVVCRWLLIGIFASVLAACGGSSSSSSNNGGGDDGGTVDGGAADGGNNNDGGASDDGGSSNGGGSGDGGAGDDGGDDGSVVQEPVVRMILIGDSGSGSDGAYAVGQAIEKVCAARGCDLVLGLGDNIYESGVSSVMDPQFEEKFELPFEPVDLPFYMVLGNHDNSEFFGGDGAGNANGDFQVDYHYRDAEYPDEARLTSRWKMPERNYRFTEGQQSNGQPFIELFGVDSNQVAGGFPDSDENYSYNNYGLAQAQWLKTAMASSQAQWRLVFAHHPYVSNGSHGNAGNYDGIPSFIAPVLAGERYKAFVEETFCDKADFFFAGHDHDLQWLMDTPACGKTEFIVSGAASKTRSIERRDENPVHYEKGDSYGFFWVEFRGDQMTGEVFEVDPNAADLGLGSLADPIPAFARSITQRASVGLPENDGFTSPLLADTKFDVDGESGNLDPVQAQLRDGFAALAENTPEANMAALMAAVGESSVALIEVVDSLLTGLQGAATEQNPELAAAGSARAMQSLLYALQSLQSSIDVAEENGGLPAPFDQLGGIFENFPPDLGGGDDSPEANLRKLTDALNALALNIQGVVDAVEEEGGSVPMVGGALSLLSELLFDVTRTVDAVGNVSVSEVGQVLVSTIDDLLSNLLLKVIPIEEFAPQEVTDAIGLGPAFFSSVLLAVTREVGYLLDNNLIPPLAPIFGALDSLLLTPLLDGLASLSEL